MTNLLTVVAKVFSNTLIFFYKNVSNSHFFQQKVSVFAIFNKTLDRRKQKEVSVSRAY